MADYVLGFCFSENFEEVALIRKNKPAHFKGLWTGIGGKIEETDKTPADAMEREFLEEAGVTIGSGEWKLFAELAIDGKYFQGKIFCFAVALNEDRFCKIQTQEDELVDLYFVDEMHDFPTIPNTKFLMEMGIDFLQNTDTFESAVINYK